LPKRHEYDEELKQQLGIKRTEGGGKSLLELISQPSLNINGFASGDVGALARNVIPTTATAVLDLRLVRGNDHQRQIQRVIEHIRKQGYHVLDREPTDAGSRAVSIVRLAFNVRAGGIQCRAHANGFTDFEVGYRRGAIDVAGQDRVVADLRWEFAAFYYYRAT
jgi:acetylornithine deacetylase/succinyl-diaminopimelate desuccinylase-like protein